MTLRIGSSGSFTKTVAASDIDAFAKASGDFNNVHMEGDRIAHGMLTAGFASAALANEMPGPGCVLVEMSMKFLSTVRIGDTVVVTVRLEEIKNPRRVWVALHCKVGDRWVASGRALMVPPEGVDVEEPDFAIRGIFE